MALVEYTLLSLVGSFIFLLTGIIDIPVPVSRADSPRTPPKLPQTAISDQTMQQSMKKLLEPENKISRKRSSEDITASSSNLNNPSKTSPKLASKFCLDTYFKNNVINK